VRRAIHCPDTPGVAPGNARGAVRGSVPAMVLCLLLALPPALAAQAPGDGRVLRLEASYLAGGVAYTGRVGGAWHAGSGLGGGVDILRVLSGREHFLGSSDAFAEYVQFSAFASWVPSTHLRTDLGLRASVILYGDAEPSGTPFVGSYLAPAVGWRRVKVGSRLQAGLIQVRGADRVAVFFQPLVVSLSLPL
jgi:hypothetical protein